MEWVTSQNSTDGETASLEDAEPDNRLASISRTSRLKSASRPQQRRNSVSVQRKQRQADRFHPIFSEKLSKPWRPSVARHVFIKSAKGSPSASRFGNTKRAWPETSSPRTCLVNSRKRRLARLRRTAIPNRFQTKMPPRLT